MIAFRPPVRYCLGAAVLAGVALVAFWPAGDSHPPGVPASAAPLWSGSLGAGRNDGAPHPTLELAPDDIVAPSALATDAAGNLVIDARLRMLFEFFLVRGEGRDLDARAAQLRAHLDRQVSGKASLQVQALANNYVAYVRAHDDLLARQRVMLQPGSVPNAQQVEQLDVWQQQRARLRRSAFPPALAELWFGADDAELAQAVAELRAHAVAAGAGASNGDGSEADVDSNTLRERRLHPPASDAQRRQDSEELLARATQSYEAAAAAERDWHGRFLQYRAAAAQLDGAKGSELRQRQLDALQARIFPSEQERIRARASGIE